MNRLDRLQAILIQLQSKRVVKAQEIADRFEISLRTVYRDVKSLEESGVPIGAEAGVGYSLADNYTLPPVMFSHEEASALIFGEKLMEKMSDVRVKQDFESAIMKIKAILRPSEKDLFEKLHNHIAVYDGVRSPNDHPNSPHLYEIQHAIAEKRVLRILYQALSHEEASLREVEPIGLCNYAARWHLIAWCRLRSDYRDFRIDRILSLSLTDCSFQNKKHLSLAEYMRASEPALDSEPNVSIVVPTNRCKYVGDTKFWYGFVQEEMVDDDNVRMFFVNNELKGFAAWLLNTGCQAKIEKPAELLDLVKSYVKQAMKTYLE